MSCTPRQAPFPGCSLQTVAPIRSLCTAGPLLAAGGVQPGPTVLLGALKWPCCSCLCPVMPNSAFPPRDGLLHGPSAAAEDVTGSASSELKFSAGFDAEWDKGQLLKGERVGLRARSLLLPPKPEGVRAAWGSWLALGTGNPSPGLYAAFWGTSPGASAEGCLLAKCWHQNHVLEAAHQGDTPREPDHQGSTRGLEQRALKITRGWDGMRMGRAGVGQDGTGQDEKAHLSLFSTESSARHAWQQVRLFSWYWRIRTWHSVPFEMFDCCARGSMEGRWQLWRVTAFSGLVLNSRSGCRILQRRALPVEQAHRHEQTAVGFA